MTVYGLLKLTHISCVAISGFLFVYRFGLLRRFPSRPLAKPLKVLPHINDTVLLIAAIAMLVLIDLNPFTMPWLLVKIILLLVYIILGAACLRASPGSRRQAVMFAAAVLVFTYIVFVALTKSAFPV